MIRPFLLFRIFLPVLLGANADAQHDGHHAEASAGGARAWTVEGKSVEADFLDASDGGVLLRTEDGKDLRVAVDALVAEDKAFASAWLAANAAPKGFGKPDLEIVIGTLPGQMKYDTEAFQVAPGTKVRLVLQNGDDMHHNLIVCQPGKDVGMEVAMEAWKLAGDGFEKQWIPEHPKLLFATRMADPHSASVLHFTAPAAEGVYPYVCTLPGHASFMKGEMTVGTQKTGLSDLKFMLFEGDWNQLPDFGKLTPVATDHVPGGLFDIRVAKRQEAFALLFSGTLTAPADGDYVFKVASDDGSRLRIDGKDLVVNDGIHPASAREGKTTLSKGEHAIELAYFEGHGEESLEVNWSGPGFGESSLSSKGKRGRKKNANEMPVGIPLSPKNGEAVIYRNFIQGAGSRAIGVGYPGGVNLAFDADALCLAMIWQGGFMDAKRHWDGRGQGEQPPLGYGVISLVRGVPFAALESEGAPWPNTARKTSMQRPENGYVFRGYTLSKETRYPTFRYVFDTITIEDVFGPSGSPATNNAGFVRNLHLSGTFEDVFYFRAAEGKSIERQDDGRFVIDGLLRIGLEGSSGMAPLVRPAGDNLELLLPLSLKNSETTITENLSWQ
jgi:azurin